MNTAIRKRSQAQEQKKILELIIANLNINSSESMEFCRMVSSLVGIGELEFDKIEDAIDYTVDKQPRSPWQYFKAIVDKMERLPRDRHSMPLSRDQQYDEFESRRNKLFRVSRKHEKPAQWCWKHIDEPLDAGDSMDAVERSIYSLLQKCIVVWDR